MPTPDELILQEEFGHKEERREDIADPDDDIDDPIDAMEDDFDEPDVPAVDLAWVMNSVRAGVDTILLGILLQHEQCVLKWRHSAYKTCKSTGS